MKKCYECGSMEDLQEHHVVPKHRGGTKTITLCYKCHLNAHGRDYKGLNHSKLVKQGLQRAKARGVKLGNPKLDEAREKSKASSRKRGDRTVRIYREMILKAQAAGCRSSREIASYLNGFGVLSPKGKAVSHKLVLRCLEKMEEK